SSRRRHTRWPRDWSSDVCSSDLVRRERVRALARGEASGAVAGCATAVPAAGGAARFRSDWRAHLRNDAAHCEGRARAVRLGLDRSEERRVGKEWRAGWLEAGEKV